LLFATGAIVCHYSTGGIMILVLLIANGIAVAIAGYYRFVRRDDARNLAGPVVTFTVIVLLLAIFFLWYNLLAQANNVGGFLSVVAQRSSELFTLESRQPGVLNAVGTGISTLPQRVRDYTYDLRYVITGLGVLAMLFARETKLHGSRYTLLVLASFIIIPLWVVIPYLSHYSILRVFQLLLVLLAVPFFIGVFAILKRLKITRQRYVLSAVLLILLVQYAGSSLLTDQAFGIPSSIVLNRSGPSWDTYYIYNQEVVAAQWLNHSEPGPSTVTADSGGEIRLAAAQFQASDTYLFGSTGNATGRYVYLQYANLLGFFGYTTKSSTGLVTQYTYTSNATVVNQVSNLFSTKNKIYENGRATIYT